MPQWKTWLIIHHSLYRWSWWAQIHVQALKLSYFLFRGQIMIFWNISHSDSSALFQHILYSQRSLGPAIWHPSCPWLPARAAVEGISHWRVWNKIGESLLYTSMIAIKNMADPSLFTWACMVFWMYYDERNRKAGSGAGSSHFDRSSNRENGYFAPLYGTLKFVQILVPPCYAFKI